MINNGYSIYNVSGGGGDEWKDISNQITFDSNFATDYNNFAVLLNENSKIIAISFVIQLKNLSTSQTTWYKIGQIDDVPEPFAPYEIIAFIPGSNYKCSFNFEYDNGILKINYKNPQTSNPTWYTASNGPLILPYK